MRIFHLVPGMALLATAALLAPPPAAVASPARVPARTPDTSPIGGELLGRRGLVAPTGFTAPPKTRAKAFVIAEAESGTVLAAKDAHGHYPPASTLKMLTAVTLIPRLDKDREIRPSRNAVNQEGSAVGLSVKATYRVEDLFRALMMSSGNDAAMALAETNGGPATTLEDMNAEARRLQALDTVAKSPSGLDRPGQRSSAYDLALIARAGLANPDFRRYVSMKTAKFPAPKGKHYEIANHNRLLWRYKGMIGVKNGWTSKAHSSFVGAARRDGHTIIVSIMRHKGYFWEDVEKLLDWGFAARGKITGVGRLVDPLPDAAVRPAPDTPEDGTTTESVQHAPAVTPRAAEEATGHTPVGRLMPPVVLGVGLIGGLIWLVRGVRRRRAG